MTCMSDMKVAVLIDGMDRFAFFSTVDRIMQPPSDQTTFLRAEKAGIVPTNKFTKMLHQGDEIFIRNEDGPKSNSIGRNDVLLIFIRTSWFEAQAINGLSFITPCEEDFIRCTLETFLHDRVVPSGAKCNNICFSGAQKSKRAVVFAMQHCMPQWKVNRHKCSSSTAFSVTSLESKASSLATTISSGASESIDTHTNTAFGQPKSTGNKILDCLLDDGFICRIIL
jgi:hypothetical protein